MYRTATARRPRFKWTVRPYDLSKQERGVDDSLVVLRESEHEEASVWCVKAIVGPSSYTACRVLTSPYTTDWEPELQGLPWQYAGVWKYEGLDDDESIRIEHQQITSKIVKVRDVICEWLPEFVVSKRDG